MKRRLFIYCYVTVTIVFTICLIVLYNKHVSYHIKNYAYDVLDKYTLDLVTSYFNNKIIADHDWQEILKVTKNSEGEILLVDFDLKQANNLNEAITNMLNDNMSNLENGIVLDKRLGISNSQGGFILYVPMFISSNWAILSNIGPKIPIKVSFIGGINTNIKTSVKDYGMNNVMAQIFITISIKENVITPTETGEYSLNYDILLDSKLIQGRVPYFYDGNISNERSFIN